MSKRLIKMSLGVILVIFSFWFWTFMISLFPYPESIYNTAAHFTGLSVLLVGIFIIIYGAHSHD